MRLSPNKVRQQQQRGVTIYPAEFKSQFPPKLQLQLERALGVYWDAQLDNFKFKAVQAWKLSTKYGVLLVAS